MPLKSPRDDHPDRLETDAARWRLSKEIIRDAPADREIEKLVTVEPVSSSSAVCWPVNYHRVRAGASDHGHLASDVAEFHLEGRVSDHLGAWSFGRGRRLGASRPQPAPNRHAGAVQPPRLGRVSS